MSKRKTRRSQWKILGSVGTVSSTGSVISLHNVCHTLCLSVVSLLSIFGVIVSSDILMFLQNYNMIFWSMGIFFLGISIILYFKYCCVSEKLLLANTGLLIVGLPFSFLQPYSIVFWLFGGSFVVVSLIWFVRDRWFHER